MQLPGIVGREVFVVYYWLRNSVTIVGVADSSDEAEKLRDKFVKEAPDPGWEKFSGERLNNIIIEPKFIEGTI